MREVEFGGCLFKFSGPDGELLLHTRDIHGVDRTHAFHLNGAFLYHFGGGVWRFVTGAGQATEARHLFDDTGKDVEKRVATLQELGVPVLSREEGKQNLDKYKLPVKRLVLST